MLEIATDASASAGNAVSAWAWYAGDGKLGSGLCRPEAPLNIEYAEMTAMLNALKHRSEPVAILTDSKVALTVLDRMREGRPATSAIHDLARDILNLAHPETTFTWVKAHAGHPLNSCADYLARAQLQLELNGVAMRGISKRLHRRRLALTSKIV